MKGSVPGFLVTVVHNRRVVSEAFAKALSAQTTQRLTLLLVDDGSTDGTADAVKQILPSTVVLRGTGNLWWAGGLQKGLNWLAAQGLAPDTPVVFMNDDVSFGPDFVERALTELENLPWSQFLVVPGYQKLAGNFLDEAVICDWPRFRFLPYGSHPEKIDCATTRSLFMRWGDLVRVGGFRPSSIPHYMSDYEFTIRAHRRGIALIPAQSVVAEFNDETTGTHRRSGASLRQKLLTLFSPRFSFQPVFMGLFVWYSVPWQWKVMCWARVFISTLKYLRN